MRVAWEKQDKTHRKGGGGAQFTVQNLSPRFPKDYSINIYICDFTECKGQETRGQIAVIVDLILPGLRRCHSIAGFDMGSDTRRGGERRPGHCNRPPPLPPPPKSNTLDTSETEIMLRLRSFL